MSTPITIEIYPEDLKLILTALESHDRICIADNIAGEMLIAIVMARPDCTEEEKKIKEKSREARIEAAEKESVARKLRSLPLRARLTESAARVTEFQKY